MPCIRFGMIIYSCISLKWERFDNVGANLVFAQPNVRAELHVRSEPHIGHEPNVCTESNGALNRTFALNRIFALNCMFVQNRIFALNRMFVQPNVSSEPNVCPEPHVRPAYVRFNNLGEHKALGALGRTQGSPLRRPITAMPRKKAFPKKSVLSNPIEREPSDHAADHCLTA